MVIAPTSIYQLGRYTVQQRPRFDNPAWAQYLVFLGEKLLGSQFSVPTISDCEWLQRQRGDRVVYAETSAPHTRAFKIRRRSTA